MDNIKNIVVGGIVTLVIGGTAYTFNQEAVVSNLANDTGISQEQAEEYVNSIPEEDFASWTEIGNDEVTSSIETLGIANDIDCENFEYEWESPDLSCAAGKSQLLKMSQSEELLGKAYIRLDADDATEDDMKNVIKYIDQVNKDYEQPIAKTFDAEFLEESKMTNAYNKSVLTAALESTRN